MDPGGGWLPLLPRETGTMMTTSALCQWPGPSSEQAREEHFYALAFLDPWLLIFRCFGTRGPDSEACLNPTPAVPCQVTSPASLSKSRYISW